MPQMARILGGFKFFPARGISAKIVNKTGIVPSHDVYDAEDCFAGTYKGVKVIWSEARLYKDRKKHHNVFDGIFVLLEIPDNIIEGHTILTANNEQAESWEHTRWKKLKRFKVDISNPHWNRFHMFSSKPQSARLLIGERFLKELSEAGDVFNNAHLAAALFAKKYIFIAIPYAENMFEASTLAVPVTTSQQAIKCKKEIEQILEIIDVYEIYKTKPNQ